MGTFHDSFHILFDGNETWYSSVECFKAPGVQTVWTLSLPCEQLDSLRDWFQGSWVAIDIVSASSATGYGKETSKNGAVDEHINSKWEDFQERDLRSRFV